MYQYKAICITRGNLQRELPHLNDLGECGWDLVAVVPDGSSFVAFLKLRETKVSEPVYPFDWAALYGAAFEEKVKQAVARGVEGE